jgi:PIN domain nuclease of toxin-antitoxin system
MRYLLDTHTFLWSVLDAPSLSNQARDIIEDASNDVFVSIVSLWEIAIKVSIGKLDLRQPFDTFIQQQLSLIDIPVLNLRLGHCVTVTKLPLHHRDPFDRMLVAQAQVENMTFISRDPVMDAYGVTRLW